MRVKHQGSGSSQKNQEDKCTKRRAKHQGTVSKHLPQAFSYRFPKIPKSQLQLLCPYEVVRHPKRRSDLKARTGQNVIIGGLLFLLSFKCFSHRARACQTSCPRSAKDCDGMRSPDRATQER